MSAIFRPTPPTPLQQYLEKMSQRIAGQSGQIHSCNCIGPQNGQPACPCQMAGVTIENGRYIRRVDLGPAP
jgi:hypothetical protein